MRIYLLTLSLLVSTLAMGQDNINKKYIINNWKKSDITAADGSKYYDEEILSANLDFNIFSKDSLEMFNGDRLSTYRYRIVNDSILQVAGLRFIIKELSDISMILESEKGSSFDFRIYYTPKHLFDLTYTPEAYKAKNGEVVFVNWPGKIEPMFVHKTMGPMDYILEKFNFSEYRTGGFVVRFVVTAQGEVKGVKVVASTNDRFNDKLIKAVYATQGLWKPAEFKGEKVSTEVEYNFDLGYMDEKRTNTKDSVALSKEYYKRGQLLITSGNYTDAMNFLKRSIKLNPLNVDAYYLHADLAFATRQKEEGCESLSYLILLEQKKAKKLYEENCK